MFGLFKHHDDKNVEKTTVTVEQNAPVQSVPYAASTSTVPTQPVHSSSATSSASSSVANAAANVSSSISNTVNKAVAGLTSSHNTVAGLTSSNNTNMTTVTKTSDTVISSASAPAPSKEYTEFVQLPKVVENTQYQTQYQAQQVQEETIKLKQQPIQVIEQPSVIKTQPIITHKQVVEVEQERPIEMVKKTVGYETLPAIEKKEVIIQPVRAVDQSVEVITKQVVENGQTVTYEVRGEASNIKALNSLNVSNVKSEQAVIDQVKESLGGVRQNAYDVRDVAPAPAVNALHSGVAQLNVSGSDYTSTSTTTTSGQGLVGRAVETTKNTAQNLLEVAREKATEVLHHDATVKTTNIKSTNYVEPGQTKVTIDAPAGASVVRQ